MTTATMGRFTITDINVGIMDAARKRIVCVLPNATIWGIMMYMSMVRMITIHTSMILMTTIPMNVILMITIPMAMIRMIMIHTTRNTTTSSKYDQCTTTTILPGMIFT